MPRVSVIVPCYNASRYIESALESVLKQSFSDWEAIVIDDGSTDNSRNVVESLLPRFEGRLRYLYQENKGVSAARNTGIRHASGELIAMLDADDIWLENRLELSVAAMDRSPGTGLTHGRVVRINREGKVTGCPTPSLLKFLSGNIARHIYTRRAHLQCLTVTFRRSLTDATGLFDEEMKSTEDRDLWFRLAEQCEVAYVPEVIAHYRISPNSLSGDGDRSLQSQIFFNEKHRNSKCCDSSAFREAMATVYRERGDSLFYKNLSQSIGAYWKAVLYHPTSWANLYMFCRALAEAVGAKAGYRSQSTSSGDAR